MYPKGKPTLPQAHPALRSLGRVRIGQFADGLFAYDNTHVDCNDHNSCSQMMGFETGQKCHFNLQDHPILRNALATAPALQEINIEINVRGSAMDTIEVWNEDGVTLGDISNTLKEWYVVPWCFCIHC